MKQNEIERIFFIIAWVVLLIIFLVKTYCSNAKEGLFYTFYVWCTLVVLTPIPEGGIIFSYPLQEFVDIHMVITQACILCIALIGLYLYKYVFKRKFGKNWILSQINSCKKFLLVAFLSALGTFAITIGIQEILEDKRTNIIIISFVVGVSVSIIWAYYLYLTYIPTKLRFSFKDLVA